MKRCPVCHRFSMTQVCDDKYLCNWLDCRTLSTIEEIEKAKHPKKFKKFVNFLKGKTNGNTSSK